MTEYGSALWFFAGAALVYFLRPGWLVVLRKDGRWVWEVSRTPCKNGPLVMLESPTVDAQEKEGGA